MKHKALIGGILGILFTPLAIALSFKSVQQGDWYWAGIFFPLLTILIWKGAGAVAFILVFMQYPLFGWYTGRCISREHYLRLAAVWGLLQIFPMLLGLLN